MVKKQHSIRPVAPSELRFLAEERLQHHQLTTPDQSTSQDAMMRMVHELEVYQVELEMLNEDLMQSRDELVISRSKMAESLERYTELYDFAPVGYLTLAPDGRILEANLMASSILGVVRTQLRDNNVQNFFIPQSLSLFKTMLDAVFIRKERGSCEVMLMVPDPQHPQDHHDPSAHTVRLDAAVNDNGQQCRVILSDITEQKQTETKLHRLTRALQATNYCNQALIHTTNEMELLQKICSIMVEVGGYRMAWVGYAGQGESKNVRIVAQAGFDEGYIKSASVADPSLGQGPTGTAICSGEPCIIRDIHKEPKFKPMLSQALERGYASVQSIPLKTDNTVFGAITIYSALSNAFDTEETKLLTALADNLAYGITTLRNRENREQAEIALLKSERNFRSITEQMADQVIVTDSIGTLTYVSPVVEKLFGYLPCEVIGHPFTDYMAEEKIPEALPVFISSLQQKTEKQIFEVKLKRKNSSLFDAEIHLQYYQDQDISGMIGLIRDISDRKKQERIRQKYEQAILKSKERYEAAIDAAQLGTWDWNVQTGEVILNKRWFEIVGYTREELAPVSIQTWRDLSHSDDFKASAAIAEQHFNGEIEHYKCECRMKHKNGHWVWVLDRGKLLARTPDGKPLRMLGTHSDITDRKLAIDQLKILSAAVEQSPAVVVITDAQGTIAYVNPMFTELTGYSAEEVKGKNPQILQSGLTPKSVYDELWKTILSGSIWRGEWQNKKKNGELFWESAVISAIQNQEGVITSFVAVKEDITEQKKMLAELIAAKEHAEESDRLKSAFLANISHEIRTPMNGIIGFSELLKEPHLTGEEQVEYVDLIQQSGRRMLNLINDLIDISRIEAGETKLQITPTPVNKVLRDLHAFFMPAISQKKLQLRSTPGLPDAESIIETDNGKLAQILTNLLQNALKFTVTGSIDFGYTRQGTTLEFYVIDTGIGIPDKMQEKIFDRFRQVDNTLTRNHEGSGLGLSITKAYVEMLGGKLSVRSAEGAGSIFTFTLPYNPVKTSDLSSPVQPSLLNPKLSGLGTQPCILIVDDDAVSRVLLVKTLQRENMTVLTAVNGQEAIDQVRHHPEISLVLLDLQLPLLNGYEAATAIKQHRPELPVIAQSAFTSKEDKQKARQAGCNTYITKPINKTELLNLITELLKC